MILGVEVAALVRGALGTSMTLIGFVTAMNAQLETVSRLPALGVG